MADSESKAPWEDPRQLDANTLDNIGKVLKFLQTGDQPKLNQKARKSERLLGELKQY